MSASPQPGSPEAPMRITPVLSSEVVDEYRRRAFTDALAELCSERGYRATTIADVVARAKSIRNTAYQHFANREDIFRSCASGSSEAKPSERRSCWRLVDIIRLPFIATESL